MKKTTSRLAKVMLLCCLGFFAVISCSKEKKLDGTTWVGTYQHKDNTEFSNYVFDYTFTLKFEDEFFTYIMEIEIYVNDEISGEVVSRNTGSFTYKKNDITLSFTDGDSWTATMDDKKTMSLIVVGENQYFDGQTITFAKQ